MKRVLALLCIVGCSEAHAVTPPKQEPPRLPLAERLAREAADRPARAVRPEQLEQALTERGVSIVRRRQVLASPVAASYCEAFTTTGGLAISLCEFPDQDAAARGRARSKASFDALIPDRTLDARGNSLLTISSSPLEAERQLVRATFAALAPIAR